MSSLATKVLLFSLASGLGAAPWAAAPTHVKARCGTKNPPASVLAKRAVTLAPAAADLGIVVARVSFTDAAFGADSTNMDSADSVVEKFFADNSGGRTHLHLRILPGIMKSTKKKSDYGTDDSFNGFATWVEGRLKAAGLVKGRDWDRYVVSFPAIDALDWIGLSGGLESPDNWINGDYDPAVIAHELGHTVGLFHAASVEAGKSPAPASPDSAQFIEYGDAYDIMGDGDITGHFCAISKRQLGWMEPAEVIDAPGPGTYRIYAHDHGAKGGPVALRLPSGKPGWDYWIEYRNTIGWRGNNARQSAGVRLDGFLEDQPVLLDMTPGSRSNSGDFQDAGLPVNQSYKDRWGAFTLKTLTATPDGDSEKGWVEVQVSSAATWISSPPAPGAPAEIAAWRDLAGRLVEPGKTFGAFVRFSK